MKKSNFKGKRRLPLPIAVVLCLFLVIVVSVSALLIFLTASAYYPHSVERLTVLGEASREITLDEAFSIVSWNTGYAALDKDNDFFMDGGEKVLGISKEKVNENLNGIILKLKQIDADIVFLQEVDENSKRSYHIDQLLAYREALGQPQAFAYNYKCAFVPYPWPTLGKINSGISTMSSFNADEAERIALPVPFSWPLSTCNLKRCLLVERINITGSEKQLVLVNLHLEAYDDGEGKQQQTDMLISLLEDEYAKGNYVIAGGDFNQTFPGVDKNVYPLIDESYWNAGTLSEEDLSGDFSYVYDDSSPTCRLLIAPYDDKAENNQYYVIDGFIVSENVKVNSVETLDEKFVYTDHNPVVMNFTFEIEDMK